MIFDDNKRLKSINNIILHLVHAIEIIANIQSQHALIDDRYPEKVYKILLDGHNIGLFDSIFVKFYI